MYIVEAIVSSTVIVINVRWTCRIKANNRVNYIVKSQKLPNFGKISFKRTHSTPCLKLALQKIFRIRIAQFTENFILMSWRFTLPTVNQAFSPSNFLGSQTWRIYRAVNNPTNANSGHASVIRIPGKRKRGTMLSFIHCGSGLYTQWSLEIVSKYKKEHWSRLFICYKHIWNRHHARALWRLSQSLKRKNRTWANPGRTGKHCVEGELSDEP